MAGRFDHETVGIEMTEHMTKALITSTSADDL